ncbi:MAG: M56 family metallopeptidase [Acidobacteriales bacterium]|nr:M56 family metallopeptidase [Terriglobales bacterium]
MAAVVEANVHEHIARVMYYFSIHLLYASIVGAAAVVLTSIPGASATTKYWVWVVTAFNSIVPIGAIVDKFWVAHLTWAAPLAAFGGPVWDMTEGRTAMVLSVAWLAGALAMLMRLIVRIRREREAQASIRFSKRHTTCSSMADGIPVSFDMMYSAPAVKGLLNPCILLPIGIDRLLNQREFEAVLIHELAHARRRDNLIRLVYELSLCVLWFHPFIWLAGARMALYRELSCDESVIQRAHGTELVSALAKLAVPERALSLQATASSHLGRRLAWLSGQQQTRRPATLAVISLFAVVIGACVFETVAHTACCFVLKR